MALLITLPHVSAIKKKQIKSYDIPMKDTCLKKKKRELSISRNDSASITQISYAGNAYLRH